MFLKKILIQICFTVMKPSIMTYWNKLKPMKNVTSSSPQTRCSTSFLGRFIEHEKKKLLLAAPRLNAESLDHFILFGRGGGAAYRWGFYCEELGVVKSLKACCQSPDKWPGGSVWRSFPRCQWLVSFLSLSQLVSQTEAITSQRSAVVHNSDELLLWWRDFSWMWFSAHVTLFCLTEAQHDSPLHNATILTSFHFVTPYTSKYLVWMGRFFLFFLFACFSWTI